MNGRTLTTRALAVALAVGASLFVAVYVVVALLRLPHPFELEWLEGGSLAQVQRILDGQPVYARPTLDYVAFPYPPLFYYAAAALSAVTGPGFVPLRVVSFASSLGCLAVLFVMVRRETGRTLPGLLAAGLFAATYRAAGSWLDVGRVDSLYLFLVLLAAHVARFGRTALSQAGAGALLALAFFTKQVAVLPALGLCAHHLLWRRRHAPALMGAFVMGTVALTLATDWTTAGWFTWHVFRPHGLLSHRFVTFWARDLVPVVPLACAAAALYALTRGAAPEARRFHLTFAAAMVATGLVSRMIIGAWLNALLPAYAGLALLFGLAFQQAREQLPAAGDPRRAGLEAALLAAAALQLVMLAGNPWASVPTTADREAGDRLLARISGVGGHVLVPSHPYLAARATGRGHAHAMAVGDLFYFGRGPILLELERDMREALCRRRFSAVVTNGTWRYEAELERHYDARPLDELGQAFWPVTGARTRPARLYLPRGDALTPSGAATACRPPAPAPANSS